MGARGPVPKRSSARRRVNKESVPDTVEVAGRVSMPKANSRWHPVAKGWYLSLAESGQSRFFEPSDWQAARYAAEVMSRALRDKPFSATLFRATWVAMADLMTTEAQRRRLRLEVDRQLAGAPAAAEPPPGVTALDDYRRSLGA